MDAELTVDTVRGRLTAVLDWPTSIAGTVTDASVPLDRGIRARLRCDGDACTVEVEATAGRASTPRGTGTACPTA